MAEYQDTRSIYAKRETPEFEPQPALPPIDWARLKPAAVAIGRWLSLVAAITLGVRLALAWWGSDTARELNRALERNPFTNSFR